MSLFDAGLGLNFWFPPLCSCGQRIERAEDAVNVAEQDIGRILYAQRHRWCA